MFGKPLHGVFPSPNAQHRAQAKKAADALGAKAPEAKAEGEPAPGALARALRAAEGDGAHALHRIADAMEDANMLARAQASTWERLAVLVERFNARLDAEAAREAAYEEAMRNGGAATAGPSMRVEGEGRDPS